MLPYYADVAGAPQNSIIGGAPCGCCRARATRSTRASREFFTYLSSAEVQADWHQATGYLPITTAAYELSKEQGFYERNPGTDTAIRQITLNPPTENSKGLRLGNYVQIRDIIDEELEAVWRRQETPRRRSTTAAARGNELLREFEARQLLSPGLAARARRGRARAPAAAGDRPAMKRVVFRGALLPLLLLAPQLAITLVFFLWPAGAGALAVAAQRRTPSGCRRASSGSTTSPALFERSGLLDSLRVTWCSASRSTVSGLAIALLLAVMADRVITGAGLYKTLLIWPYAVAPAVAGVLWLFMFNPTIGILAYLLEGPRRTTGTTSSTAARR